ncbi:hypothetical protein NUW54_g503 [Trametes sanguinea]|uniref:Uncharacterized protein n=1 Tax=Trametes sanguinea TaxID=158606 RepID=A0ACC1QBG5_9APHY|nr:hypothetical protein NUW54_g503 [Trametes sanguinea]
MRVDAISSDLPMLALTSLSMPPAGQCFNIARPGTPRSKWECTLTIGSAAASGADRKPRVQPQPPLSPPRTSPMRGA